MTLADLPPRARRERGRKPMSNVRINLGKAWPEGSAALSALTAAVARLLIVSRYLGLVEGRSDTGEPARLLR